MRGIPATGDCCPSGLDGIEAGREDALHSCVTWMHLHCFMNGMIGFLFLVLASGSASFLGQQNRRIMTLLLFSLSAA
jgi:hypothetical protein